jgi:hypothetical protein
MLLIAGHVSVSEDDNYFQIAFDSQDPGDDDDADSAYLIIQRQFENADGRRCYIESHDDRFIGHFRLRLVELTVDRLAFTIERVLNRNVEVKFAVDASRFENLRRIVGIVFGPPETIPQ